MSIRIRQRLGKYRIEARIGEGGFANVYRAFDTIEGIRVALKIPKDPKVNRENLESMQREVRIAAKLDHPNIVPLKNADFIGDHFVIATPLAKSTLADRMRRRMKLATSLDFAEQIIEGVAYAHEQRVIHCDIKPENILIFSDGWVRLSDFGIAKLAWRTVRASGSGTVGYLAPEQAMGRPSYKSDVFSLGLVLVRLFSGKLPEYPFAWPTPGHPRMRGRVHPDMLRLMRRAIELEPRKRFKDAVQVYDEFLRIKRRTRRYWEARKAL